MDGSVVTSLPAAPGSYISTSSSPGCSALIQPHAKDLGKWQMILKDQGLEEALGSSLLTVPALALGAIWIVNQQMADLSLTLFQTKVKYIFFKKRKCTTFKNNQIAGENILLKFYFC